MSEPFLGEIKMITWNFPAKGWAFCNGQTLPINQNQALFSLLGTVYGGDGRTTFALPNLQGRTPIHMGAGFNLGQTGGEQAHTLTVNELPAHMHPAIGSTAAPSAGTPVNNLWCQNPTPAYATATPDVPMSPNAMGNAGGSQPHQNLSPYLVLNFCIALVGIFPTRN